MTHPVQDDWNKHKKMNLVAARVKQGMCGTAKAGAAIKRETTQNQPDVQLSNVQVRNTEAVS